MDFSHSPRALDLREQVRDFMNSELLPVEQELNRDILRRRHAGEDAWRPHPLIKGLQRRARDAGLWNLFLPAEHSGRYARDFGCNAGVGLTNLDYAPLAEEMGRSPVASLIFNCNAPDTGNMELLLRYGSREQRDTWLEPLLNGDIRSAFCMTEPAVASSDATNMEVTAVESGGEIILNGRKWFATGLGHPDCELLIVMGLSNPDAPRHARHSMVIVPRNHPGVQVERMVSTLGSFDEPLGHGQVSFNEVRVPSKNVVLGLGRAFEIAQGRLGPGRVHHCMRLIGLAERSLELACLRATSRTAFGRPLAKLGGNAERIGDARIAIERSRLLVLHAAWLLDAKMSEQAATAVSAIKVDVPTMTLEVIDLAIQLHGAAGLTDDFPLASAWTLARSLRLADGPDEVHRSVVARAELRRHQSNLSQSN